MSDTRTPRGDWLDLPQADQDPSIGRLPPDVEASLRQLALDLGALNPQDLPHLARYLGNDPGRARFDRITRPLPSSAATRLLRRMTADGTARRQPRSRSPPSSLSRAKRFSPAFSINPGSTRSNAPVTPLPQPSPKDKPDDPHPSARLRRHRPVRVYLFRNHRPFCAGLRSVGRQRRMRGHHPGRQQHHRNTHRRR